jgi:hypothetical protein
LAVVNFTGNSVTVLAGNGDGTFRRPQTLIFPTLSSLIQVQTADFNHDGKLDLLVAGAGTDFLSLGNGDGTFQAPLKIHAGLQLGNAAIGDFNGDGNPDAAVIDIARNVVSILLGGGDGTFRPGGSFFLFGSIPQGIKAEDFNGDGRLDLAVTGLNSHTVEILPGDGTGGFGMSTIFRTGTFAQDLTVADFNADGRPDIAVIGTGSVGGGVVLLINDSGK